MSAYEPDKYQGFLYAAYKDILAVESLCEFGNVHFEAIAFHAQQAAEKILKNVLVENGVMPPRTHNLDDLVSISSEKAGLTPAKEEIAASMRLSVFAVNIRYTQMPDIQGGEALRAMLDCNLISRMAREAGYDSPEISEDTIQAFEHLLF